MLNHTIYLRSIKVTTKGTEYNAGEIVMLPSDVGPAFSIIWYLFQKASDETRFLMLEVLETVAYDVHYHAFRVKCISSPSLVTCKQTDLVDPHPLVLNRTFDLGAPSNFYLFVLNISMVTICVVVSL